MAAENLASRAAMLRPAKLTSPQRGCLGFSTLKKPSGKRQDYRWKCSYSFKLLPHEAILIAKKGSPAVLFPLYSYKTQI
jgi:hypothetical protein